MVHFTYFLIHNEEDIVVFSSEGHKSKYQVVIFQIENQEYLQHYCLEGGFNGIVVNRT